MGTLQNQIRRVFEMIAEACRELPVQLVISLGGSDDADEYAHLPGNPITVGYAPQLELLQKASLCITHAGLNTALESIAHGVPMLAIPITNDQPGVAARIQHHGLGRTTRLEKMTVPKVRTTQRALNNAEQWCHPPSGIGGSCCCGPVAAVLAARDLHTVMDVCWRATFGQPG